LVNSYVSSAQAPSRRLFYVLRSRTEFARKYWPRWKTLVLMSTTITLEMPARVVLALGKGRWCDVHGVAIASWWYARYAIAALHKRPGTADGG
jgi:hypothetical protein